MPSGKVSPWPRLARGLSTGSGLTLRLSREISTPRSPSAKKSWKFSHPGATFGQERCLYICRRNFYPVEVDVPRLRDSSN